MLRWIIKWGVPNCGHFWKIVMSFFRRKKAGKCNCFNGTYLYTVKTALV